MVTAKDARTQGPAFALGWVVGLAAVSTVVTLLSSGDSSDEPSTAVSWVKLAIGLLFLALAAKQWQGRPRPGHEPAPPAWMATIESMAPGRCVGIGAALSGANPKNLALTVAAAASIGQAGLDGGGTAVAIAAFVVLGSLTVVGPVALVLVAPGQASTRLIPVKQFLSEHNAAIMMAVLLLLGVKLLGNGLAGIVE
jgi:hypothetical protein